MLISSANHGVYMCLIFLCYLWMEKAPLLYLWNDLYNRYGFPGGSVVKNPPGSIGDATDVSLILGRGRSLGGGNGNPLQYSCLESPVPGTEDSGGLQSMGLQELDMTEQLSTHICTYNRCWFYHFLSNYKHFHSIKWLNFLNGCSSVMSGEWTSCKVTRVTLTVHVH